MLLRDLVHFKLIVVSTINISKMSFPERVIALITGTSSNLGLNIAYRLLTDVPADKRLTIIVTSRTLPKAKEVINEIKKYNETKLTSQRTAKYLDFDYLLIDFTNMVSILSAIYDLDKQYEKLDYLFINAAQGVYDGIDWIAATKEVLTNPVKASTFPEYKIQRVGVKSKDGLGLVFQANAFGPFYFIQKLTKLLKNSSDPRIVWISSIMSYPSFLSFDDLQLLKSDISYEGSKRLVDLIHLATYQQLYEKYGIKQYVTHPGIFTSFSFFKFLNVFTYYGMLLMFYFARLLGSKWHNISGWTAANAPVYVALKAQVDSDNQKLKYCSASNLYGVEHLEITEIDETGKEDVLDYFKKLEAEWDEKLKDQITISRRP